MDYSAKAGAYVNAFMEAIHWDNAVKLCERHSREGNPIACPLAQLLPMSDQHVSASLM